jgi:hypothetical protein
MTARFNQNKLPPAPDSLKYELRTSKVKGKLVNQIVCEGVVVDTYELAQER